MKPIDNPQFYCIMLRLDVDNFVVHNTIFDNSSEASWLGRRIVEKGSATAYQVFPIAVSKDSYERMNDYIRFGMGI